MSKAKASKAVTTDGTNVLKVTSTERDPTKLAAQVALRPETRAAVTIQSFSKKSFGQTDLSELVAQLDKLAHNACTGDMGRAESMLMVQAHTLDALFNELAGRAAVNMGQHLGATETYLRLAFKAQAQCRATLETLHEVKFPKAVAFVRQANIAHGPQQVNNGATLPDDSRARAFEVDNAPSKLLEDEHATPARLDTGTPRTATSDDSHMATLGTIYRPPNARR